MKYKILLIFFTALLLISPAAAAVERVENGDFSNGLNGWESGQSTSSAGGTASVSASNGVAEFVIETQGSGTSYAYIQQTVDFDYVETLTFDVRYTDRYNLNGNVFSVSLYDASTSRTLLTISGSQLTPSWQSFSVDVSSYSGDHDLRFYASYNGETGYPHSITLELTDVSALSIAAPPEITDVTLSANILPVGETLTLTADYTPGYPAETMIWFEYSDGYQDLITTSTGTAVSTRTFTSPGIYTVTVGGTNDYANAPYDITETVEVISLDFSATQTSGEPPLTVGFQLSAVGFDSFRWDFGDGTTSTELNPYHTYSQTGSYTVSLTGTTESGKTYTKTKADYINLAPQSITWSAAKYTSGDTATISWQLRSPDYTNYQYTLHIYQSDSFGNALGDSIVTSSLSGASGTYPWDTTGSVGYYTAAVIRTGGSAPATLMSATAQVVSTATLTVNLATNGVTYTEPTTVTLTQSGTIIDTQTTSSGQVLFTTQTGTYQVSATTTGYATQTASVQLLENTAITIDFVTGTSQSGSQGGSGSSYASTFVTFRIQDSGTGKYVDGARIIAVGVQPTNPMEWMANLFGAAWGENIIDTRLEGISDMNGVITFAMFPNVRYQLTITYNDITETRSFQPSTLTGEYLISLPITETNKVPATTAVQVSVTTEDKSRIIVTYADSTQTTSQITASLYQIVDGERQLLETQPANSQETTLTFSPPSPSGREYIVSISAVTEAYGTIEREFAVGFPGPMVKIGNLPDEAYMVLCFIILLMLAGVGTFITSRMYALVLVFVAILLWWFGWMFALGPVGGIALIICFILAIAYYIATGGQPQ